MCIDYRKLNRATKKENQPLLLIDQILEKLSTNSYFCHLDGFTGVSQIAVHPENQEKTTFTCPYGTYAYRRMPFGLCNTTTTFKQCMHSIFEDFVHQILEVLIDSISFFCSNFDNCLYNLNKVLQRCEEGNYVLNWEKCHFMITEETVLGHKVSNKGS